MDLNQKAKEFANNIKNSNEFRYMNKCKIDIDKNKSLKKQFDSYISKKNNIYSRYNKENTIIKINNLNKEYEAFFNIPLISEYMQATKKFNIMMEKLYKTIEIELLK